MDFHPLRYLALGDSLTAGIGVLAFDPGFVEYYRCLSQQTLEKCIQLKRFARSGATTDEILTMLCSPIIEEAVKYANIITITAGGDDLINAAKAFIKNENEQIIYHALEKSQDNYSKILDKIQQIDKQDNYIIRLSNLYNPFPDIPIAEEGIRAFNSLIYRFSQEKNVRVANIYDVFKGNEKILLSRDGIHPNNKGYYQMAVAFHNLGYSPLDSGANMTC